VINGTPSEDELVAIVAAVEAVWPRPVVVVEGGNEAAAPWRFSGRWWARPIPTRRDRPWIG
jgi:hypothetical protein